jgi:hypothetical protein
MCPGRLTSFLGTLSMPSCRVKGLPSFGAVQVCSSFQRFWPCGAHVRRSRNGSSQRVLNELRDRLDSLGSSDTARLVIVLHGREVGRRFFATGCGSDLEEFALSRVSKRAAKISRVCAILVMERIPRRTNTTSKIGMSQTNCVDDQGE